MESSKSRIVSTAFKGLLNVLSTLDLRKSEPRVFLVYAHESKDSDQIKQVSGDARVAHQLIKWLQKKLEINLYSDRSKFGNDTDVRNARNSEDILWSQLNLLTSEEHAMSHVIVCGSSLLKSYTISTFYHEYEIAIRNCLNQLGSEKNWTKELLFHNLSPIVCEYNKKSAFHHVLTELIFLQIRRMSLSDQAQSQKLIPFLLNHNDEKNVLPEFISAHEVNIEKAIFRHASNWGGGTYENEGLHLAFFELLERLYIDSKELTDEIHFLRKKYTSLVKGLKNDIISEEEVKNKISALNKNQRDKIISAKSELNFAFNAGISSSKQRQDKHIKTSSFFSYKESSDQEKSAEKSNQGDFTKGPGY